MQISIKDKPIQNQSEDQLKINKYADALVQFILNSDTPITIGLQGEWGTGKTSMMNLLRESLADKNVATSWVNTWEYSMFRGVKETTPAVMNGLLTTLQESCGDQWTIKNETDKKMKKIGRFFGNLVNQVSVNQLGLDIKDAADAVKGGEDHLDRAAIAQIKSDIEEVIEKLIVDTRNPYQRVVFFVDDLDRINPSDAVEVLESLKNIFDLNHCIFVLAIDYEVVVKGLESKFGPKTDDNEREFRSFFDKIIQVPFTMPVGSYDIDSFLKQKLAGLGMELSNEHLDQYLQVVKHSVGYNPRSLKRFINSFSLLNTIRRADLESDQENQRDEQRVALMLFSLLGIQITYPSIFRAISINPEYKSWNQAQAAKWNLDMAVINEKVALYGENELVDEEWEKVAWGLCQTDAFLKSRAFSILELLNTLSDFFEEELTDYISEAMEFASMTAVDDHQESKQAWKKVGNKTLFNGLESKKKALRDWGANESALQAYSLIWDVLDKEIPNSGGSINFAASATTIRLPRKEKDSVYFYCKNPAKKSPAMRMWVKWGRQTHADVKAFISEHGLSVDQEISFSDGGGIVVEIKLLTKVGANVYNDFLKMITTKVVEFSKV